MFKNLIVYRLAKDWACTADALQDALEAERFAPCGATQPVSAGWVPPRGEPGAPLLENIDGHWLLSLCIEKRLLPSSVVRERVAKMADAIELETGRRPGKKQRRDLKEQAVIELLPRAFTRQSHLRVWIAPALGLLMVDAPSIGKADDAITLLVRAVSSINMHLLQTAESPAACMAAWLMDGVPPDHFVLDRDCELKAADEMRAAVRYTRHNLDIDELKGHLTTGKMPTRLALTWRERVSFTLTDAMTIKGIKFLDIVFDGRDKPAKDEAFDADAALATGELAQLIPDLVEGLGGELDFIGQSAGIAQQHAPIPAGTVIDAGTVKITVGAPAPAAAPPATQTSTFFGDRPDPMYDQAVAIVRERRRASISLVQRHLRIGYNRAACLLVDMEKAGVVSAMAPDGSRTLIGMASC